MKTSRSTAERIRPILQAMERSIDTARRRRLHNTDAPVEDRPATLDKPEAGGEDAPRRKARPKRATPVISRYDASEYRAEIA